MVCRNIVVVGAGPVGTVAALACARLGHQVTLLEAQERVDDSPRASTTQPPTLEILAELGLVDEYIAQGLVARTFQFWDRSRLRLVAEFDFERLRGETTFPFFVQTEQHKLANMGIARVRTMPNASVRMATRVTDIAQDTDGVNVQTEQGALRADYVIGCDGGRSTVRKSIGVEFEGFTWPERFLVITTKFDFAAALGCCLRNYMADPQEWTNLFKVAGDDLTGSDEEPGQPGPDAGQHQHAQQYGSELRVTSSGHAATIRGMDEAAAMTGERRILRYAAATSSSRAPATANRRPAARNSGPGRRHRLTLTAGNGPRLRVARPV